MSYVYKEEEPTVVKGEKHSNDSETLSHPAFGVITMSMVRGANVSLFGSDLGHSSRVCIRISTADLDRHLHRDWIHSRKEFIQIELSQAQFAQFITSNGNGSGTPVTIRYRTNSEGKYEQIPYIKPTESKHDVHRREIQQSAQSQIDTIMAGVASLKELAESGKIGKKALDQAINNIEHSVNNLPANLSFAVESAEEALEKATSDAKIEVESYIQQTATRLGLNSISDLNKLEYKDGS